MTVLFQIMIKGKTEGEMSMQQIHKGICNYWKSVNYFWIIKWKHKGTNQQILFKAV